MEETTTTRSVSISATETISERLSRLDDLYFPRALQSSASSPALRKPILLDLLLRDPAVFLERYGSQLTSDELGEFDALKDDYEVNWHLKRLQSTMNPTSEQLHSRSVIVKNRRWAYLNKLISEGQYFSEDSMREREPYLHYEYVGKFQDLSVRSMARAGERWSETLMRRAEEAILVAKIRGEQQRLGVAERDWIGNERNQEAEVEEEEEKEDEEEEDEEAAKMANGGTHSAEMQGDHPDANEVVQSTTASHTEGATISEAEMQELMDQFTYIMQQKFLSGEDYEHLDYSKIDDDETLDDHWHREANRDAEDKYFTED